MRYSILNLFRNRVSGLFFAVLLGLVLVRCTHTQATKEDADSIYNEAEEAYKDEKYLIAIEKYRDIKNRFPYSARATDAELRIADAYFAQESYIEAESAYEIFKELHPTHPKADYVQYRIGLSFYNQIPDNATRDLTAAYRSIEAFQQLIDKYPGSEYVAKAKESMIEAKKRLAEFENYVADFYFQRRHYLSATYRYSALLQEYPNLGYDEEALYRLGQSYYNIRMYNNAKDALQRLMQQFPDSSYKGRTQDLLKELEAKNSP